MLRSKKEDWKAECAADETQNNGVTNFFQKNIKLIKLKKNRTRQDPSI